MKPYKTFVRGSTLSTLHDEISWFINPRSFEADDRFFVAAELAIAARRLLAIANKHVQCIADLYNEAEADETS